MLHGDQATATTGSMSGPEGARLARREEGEGRGARRSDLLLGTDNNRKGNAERNLGFHISVPPSHPLLLLYIEKAGPSN